MYRPFQYSLKLNLWLTSWHPGWKCFLFVQYRYTYSTNGTNKNVIMTNPEKRKSIIYKEISITKCSVTNHLYRINFWLSESWSRISIGLNHSLQIITFIVEEVCIKPRVTLNLGKESNCSLQNDGFTKEYVVLIIRTPTKGSLYFYIKLVFYT